MVSEADIPLVRLPIQLSNAVDTAVRKFVKGKPLKAHLRWQDADLWIVYGEEPGIRNNTPVILQKRVTVAAFAGDTGFEPDIVFTPDILLITSEGRYVLPGDKRKQGQDTIKLDVPENRRSLTDKVVGQLGASWEKTKTLASKLEDASVLLA